MDKLNANWITEGTIDFEYKKYILLAYLQSAGQEFRDKKIYPYLSDLIVHHRNLTEFRDQKQLIEDQLPKEISKIDLQNFFIQYRSNEINSKHLEEIEQIISFAIPKISSHISIAKNIYDEAEHQIDIETVGLVPFYFNEGYLLLRANHWHHTLVYQYELSIYESGHEQLRSLKTNFFETYPLTFYNYDEAIKSDLIKRNKSLPNPATFRLNFNVEFPFRETMFPVAKRTFVRYLSSYTN